MEDAAHLRTGTAAALKRCLSPANGAARQCRRAEVRPNADVATSEKVTHGYPSAAVWLAHTWGAIPWRSGPGHPSFMMRPPATPTTRDAPDSMICLSDAADWALTRTFVAWLAAIQLLLQTSWSPSPHVPPPGRSLPPPGEAALAEVALPPPHPEPCEHKHRP